MVIPCFNYARFLPEAVESALSQAGVVVDVIIVDDASTDDSLAVAHRLAASDARVRVLAHPANAGPVRTFNDGLVLASGEFLVRLDADDLLTPGSLRRAADMMRSFPEVGLVYGRPLHFSRARQPARTEPRTWTVWPGMRWLADRCADGFNVITSPEAFMRMSVVQRVGGQRLLAHTHDMEMWLRLAAHADVAYVSGADQAWHRDHPASLSAREVDQLSDLRERADAFRELVAGVAGRCDGVAELGGVAARRLAREAVASCHYELDRGRRPVDRIESLLKVAAEIDPEIISAPDWTRVRERLDGPRSVVGHGLGLMRATLRRVHDVRRHRRWLRTGVYG